MLKAIILLGIFTCFGLVIMVNMPEIIIFPLELS